MKKLLFLLSIFFLFISCSPAEDEVATYLIVDRDTNQVMNSYEYDSEDTLHRTIVYDETENIRQIEEYEFDDDGNLTRLVRTIPGESSQTLFYTTRFFYDELGRIERSLRTSTNGETLETFYGYDEGGILRGIVEEDGEGNIYMKDYE